MLLQRRHGPATRAGPTAGNPLGDATESPSEETPLRLIIHISIIVIIPIILKSMVIAEVSISGVQSFAPRNLKQETGRRAKTRFLFGFLLTIVMS